MELLIGALLLAAAIGLVVYVVLSQADDKAMVRNSLRQLGTVLGIAVLGAVFAARGDFTTPQAFLDGLRPALWLAVAALAAGTVTALLIPALPGHAEQVPGHAEQVPVQAPEPAETPA